MSTEKHFVQRINFMKHFQCIGGSCWDNCCLGWTVDVDKKTLKRYEKQAPELLDKTVERIDKTGTKMKFDGKRCICLDKDNMCVVHAKYGEDFLPCICYYFPNIYKQLDKDIYMPTGLGCPASMEAALYAKDSTEFGWHETEVPRVREQLVDYMQNAISKDKEQLLDIHKTCMNIVSDEKSSANELLSKLLLFVSEYSLMDSGRKIKKYKDLVEKVNKKEFSQKPLDMVTLVENISKILDLLIIMQDKATNVLFKAIAEIVIKNLKESAPLNNVESIKNQVDVLKKDEAVLKNEELMKKIKDLESKVGALDKKADTSEMDKIVEELKKDKIHVENQDLLFLLEKWNVKAKNEVDKLFKNYIRAKLVECIFPICDYWLDERKTVFMLTIQYLLIRLILMNFMDKDGNLPNKEEIIKIFQVVDKFFYSRKKQKTMDMCMGIFDCQQTNYLINLIKSL